MRAWRQLVPGWRSGSPLLECSELGQGSGGEVWRVSTAQGSWVVKQHLHEDSAVDLRRMQELQNLAAQHGLAPRIVTIDLTSGIEVSEWLRGVVATAAEFEQADVLQRVAQRLGDLHRIPVPRAWAARAAWQFDIRHHLQLRWSRLQTRADVATHGQLAPRVHEAIVKAAVMQKRQRPLSLLHLDVHAGNLLACGAWVLLDWEYACLGDPIWDLASLLAPLPVDERLGMQLIRTAGRQSDTNWQELRTARELFMLLNELWRVERVPLAGTA
jgi:thiamine kinase-like enzyme